MGYLIDKTDALRRHAQIAPPGHEDEQTDGPDQRGHTCARENEGQLRWAAMTRIREEQFPAPMLQGRAGDERHHGSAQGGRFECAPLMQHGSISGSEPEP